MKLSTATLTLLLSSLATTALAAPKKSGCSQKTAKDNRDVVLSENGQFCLNGKPFYFSGSNSYWISQIPNDVEAVFKSLQQSGEKVLRIWGFNMVESTLAEPQNPDLAFYQLWLNGTWYLNAGSNGLQRFDQVVKLAEKYDVKLIIPLTNNWEGYGSMDLYNKQITGNDTYHDVFYTDSRVVDSYQRYVNQIVSRYKDSKAIFSWELANEPRCNGYPAINSGKCTPASLTRWIKDQSAYIKSIDPKHMVCVGDEGFLEEQSKHG